MSLDGVPRSFVPYPCLGGQGTVPYEQKTQQSPGFDFTSVRQAGHSQNRTQASVGMVSDVSAPQYGQQMVDSVTGSAMRRIYCRFGDRAPVPCSPGRWWIVFRS